MTTAVTLSPRASLLIDRLEGSRFTSRGVCLSMESHQSGQVEVCAVIPAERLQAVIEALQLHAKQLHAERRA